MVKNYISIEYIKFLFVFICLSYSQLFANTYYVSSTNGNDGYSLTEAQQPNTPWKTLAKLNAMSSNFKPNDFILLNRGDVFFGALQINVSGTNGSPIIIGAYGNGNLPEITGFATLGNWQQKGNGIWETTVAGGLGYMSTVVVNGISKAVGRYPNATSTEQGYLHFQSFNTNTSITDSKLAGQPDWSGGQIVIRKNRFVLDRNTINSQSGTTINYTSQSGYYPDQGFGYFIQNHPSTLDVNGEWYYQSGKFGIYTGSASPNSNSIQAGIVETLVTLSNQSNLTFKNIRFTGASANAFNINSCQNISISSCEIVFSGKNAISAYNSNGITLENSMISNTGNIACLVDNCSSTVLNNNQIRNTGIVAGMGEGDSGSYEGVLIGGNNNLIENNSIDSTGYIPITFSGNNVTIKNNVINHFTMIKDDGGGIYTWNNGSNPPTNSGRIVTGNVVLNGIGAPSGTSELNKFYSHGIYADDNAGQVDITNNTVASCAINGIYIHNAHDINIKQNTVYNNSTQLLIEHDNVAPNSPIYNISVTGNILFAKQASQLAAAYKTKDNDIANFGMFDNNYYYRPIDNDLVIGVLQQINGVYSYNLLSVASWKALYGRDANSTASSHKISPYTITNVSGGNQFSNGNFDNNIGGLYAYSSGNNCSTTWASGVLDGGALRVSFSSNTNSANYGSVIIGIGAIIAGNTYRLKFSMLGSNSYKAITAYLRQSGGSYTDLSERKSLTITSNRTENEFVFTALNNENDASIVFDVPEQPTSVYLDNIQLNKVDATFNDPNNLISFFLNSSFGDLSFNVPQVSYDAVGSSYQNSIKLSPFTSLIVVQDGTNVILPPTVNCAATGTILREEWDNVPGNNISDVPLTSPITSSSLLTAFEGPHDIGDNYASRIRGYICPPQTGSYTFWIAGDDAAELWLSTDSTSMNKVRIANLLSWTGFREWTKFPSQKSDGIQLQAGKKYYIEALHKEGGGGDNLSVQWQLPDMTLESPIAGSHLSPYTLLKSQTISFPTIPSKNVNDAPFTLTATASSNLAVSFSIISGPATLANNVVTITGAGVVTIAASQVGDSFYDSAPTLTQQFTVSAPSTNTCSATGYILREEWDNVGGNDISDVPVNSPISSSSQLTVFEGPTDIADNYADRIRGYICAPQTGNYTFWVAADDAAELWLSTDDNAVNKVKIASVASWTGYREWNKFPSQQSATITLQAGKKYYIEALHKEGGGGDNFSVQWQLPDASFETPIAGSHLSPFVSLTSQTIDFPAIGNKMTSDGPFTINATATSGLPVSFSIISGPATLSSNIITLTGAGIVTVQASQPGNTTYNAASNVTQNFSITSPAPTSACTATGTILREEWDNAPGNNISDIPLQMPISSSSQITSMEGPTNIGDNYASRIRGYICAPQTGNYTFWIAADDAAELWLSTDDNPSNKVKLAFVTSWTDFREWTKYASQMSIPISLQAGKKYYVEVLHKEGNGGDNLSVKWQLPDGSVQAPLPGNYLSPFLSTSSPNVALASYNKTTSSTNAIKSTNKEADSTKTLIYNITPELSVYPNPVFGQASVNIVLPESMEVILSLFSSYGIRLKDLYVGNIKANIKTTFRLDSENILNGVYFISLKSPKINITRKLNILYK